MNIHTENALRFQPMLAINAMENGGMCFTDDGEYLDAADQPMDPGKVWLDFENGDGARGHIPLAAEDFETDEERDDVLDMNREDEIALLLAEQAKDEKNTHWVDSGTDDKEEDSEEQDVHEGDRGILPMRFDDRSASNSDYRGHRTNNKGGWIARNCGRKPQYKDHRSTHARI